MGGMSGIGGISVGCWAFHLNRKHWPVGTRTHFPRETKCDTQDNNHSSFDPHCFHHLGSGPGKAELMIMKGDRTS